MMTSTADSTPAVITASAVTAVLIASLYLTSFIQTSYAIPAFNSSNAELQLPSSASSSLTEQGDIHWVQHQQELLLLRLRQKKKHRTARKAADQSKPKDSKQITCYKCSYLQNGQMTIDPECNDPFNSNNIPLQTCAGSCFKMKSNLASEGHTLVRGCSTNCEEKIDQHGYIRCCKENKCNRSASLNSTKNAVQVICSVILGLVVVHRFGNKSV